VYRCKICSAVKSKKNGYFKVPDENRVNIYDHLGYPAKLRIMLRMATAHLNEGQSLSEYDLEIVDI
jgi:hypothetical protein